MNIVVPGELALGRHEPGTPVKVALIGSSFQVETENDVWKVPASAVEWEGLSPQRFAVTLRGATYEFRPEDAVRVRLELEPALELAQSMGRRRRKVRSKKDRVVAAQPAVERAPIVQAPPAQPAPAPYVPANPVPAHANPVPANPVPANLAPVNPAPVNPMTVNPAPASPLLASPVQATPVPSNPAPAPHPVPADEVAVPAEASETVPAAPAPSQRPVTPKRKRSDRQRSTPRRRPLGEGRVVQRQAPEEESADLAVFTDEFALLVAPVGRAVSGLVSRFRRTGIADSSSVPPSDGEVVAADVFADPCDIEHQWVTMPAIGDYERYRCGRCDEVRIDVTTAEPTELVVESPELVDVWIENDEEAIARARRMVSHRGARPVPANDGGGHRDIA